MGLGFKGSRFQLELSLNLQTCHVERWLQRKLTCNTVRWEVRRKFHCSTGWAPTARRPGSETPELGKKCARLRCGLSVHCKEKILLEVKFCVRSTLPGTSSEPPKKGTALQFMCTISPYGDSRLFGVIELALGRWGFSNEVFLTKVLPKELTRDSSSTLDITRGRNLCANRPI